MKYKFNASTGGHAPGHIREMFEQMFDGYDWEKDEDEIFYHDGKKVSPQWVIGQLWNCTDIMPSCLRDSVSDIRDDYDSDFSQLSTYAQGARLLKGNIEKLV